jgi:Zn-finger nucleic acid-binding protein
MNCPICNVELKMADRQGVEIDYCPQCRGVWLDRGELDKIIERSMTLSVSDDSRQWHQNEPRGYDHHDKHEYDKYRKHKKRGFLGEIFDFGD